ncbi:hypothetical protein ND2E_4254 [Colwellia psychrerythraea]|uniref:Uncharacterized protein n=1 Tax=Colwellia psychrerythraea TaxID=28229 RepID=A0A099KFK8_COLPS|nr:hypothetical protein ND2E_4254 [Colwellia psychrerythraea]
MKLSTFNLSLLSLSLSLSLSAHANEVNAEDNLISAGEVT